MSTSDHPKAVDANGRHGWIADFRFWDQLADMSDLPKVKLSRLREIGWSLWDPIGLRELSDGEWQDGGGCADEYDGYLLQVVGRLRRGESLADVSAYLEDTEVGHIGLTRNSTTSSRARDTVEAISNYLSSLPAGALKVR